MHDRSPPLFLPRLPVAAAQPRGTFCAPPHVIQCTRPFNVCRAPTVVVGSITPTSAVATITPPTKGRPWSSYSLTLCLRGTQSCNTTACAAVASANSPTNCSLTELSMGTSYTLTVGARRSDGTQSPDSEPAQFTTPVYP